MEEMRNVYKILVGRPRQRWKDNIEMGIKEIWCENVDWFDQIQDKNQYWSRVSTTMNFQVP
jgi:hypothetical protein